MNPISGSPQVRELLLGLPVIKAENVPNYRQTIIRAESHPSMFVGSTSETAGFVARMSEETERHILSSQGIARVEKRYLMNNYRVGERILEIQYQQYWSNGTSSIYSEHVMRIGEDRFEVFGSESSARRMKAAQAPLAEAAAGARPAELAAEVPAAQQGHIDQGVQDVIHARVAQRAVTVCGVCGEPKTTPHNCTVYTAQLLDETSKRVGYGQRLITTRYGDVQKHVYDVCRRCYVTWNLALPLAVYVVSALLLKLVLPNEGWGAAFFLALFPAGIIVWQYVSLPRRLLKEAFSQMPGSGKHKGWTALEYLLLSLDKRNQTPEL